MSERMKRRRIRKAELLVIAQRQGFSGITPNTVESIRSTIARHGTCECGCGLFFYDGSTETPAVEYDHRVPNALLYDGDYIDWRALLPACHANKTKTDVANIAKAKRLAGETGQKKRRDSRGGSSIKGRGFDKPPGYKHQWPSRKLESRNTFRR